MTNKSLKKLYTHTSKGMGAKKDYLQLSKRIEKILKEEGKL